MMPYIEINNRRIGAGYPVYIVAEMSANHHQDLAQALQILKAAKDCGADAVKIQTYIPDTLTIRCDNEHFRIGKGTIWEGRNLYDLYSEAFTPWEWQPELKSAACDLGLDFFSTPYDATAVDFLERMDIPAYKIASFELVDLALIRHVAATGKPMILSTGMATIGEIDEAVHAARESGATQLALLKCTSAYPAPPDEMNLQTIPHLGKTFAAAAGLSDHTTTIAVSVAAVVLGACIIEKHFTLSRDVPGPDSSFSLEPRQFKEMVEAIRMVERALGSVHYELTKSESASRIFRRSLFVVEDMQIGDVFTQVNVRSIRPGYGLHPRYLKEVLGRRAARCISRGTPVSWDIIS